MVKKTIHPYQIIKQRIDVVVRVPAWAKGLVEKHELVARLEPRSVRLGNGSLLALGESYTEFWDYAPKNW